MAVVVALALAAAAYAAPGGVDRSFGTDGTTTVDFPVAAQPSVALREPDGGLVAVGTVDSTAFGLVRYGPDQAIDSSFGTGGRVMTELGQGVSVRDATMGIDGRILVAGTADGAPVAGRYNADGSLDSTFGTGGIERGDSVATSVAAPVADATQTGDAADPATVADAFAAEFRPEAVTPLALQTLPWGRILAVGSASVAGDAHLALAELDGDGSPTASYGDGRRAVDPLAAGVGPVSVEAAAVQDDGKVVVAGPTAGNPGGLAVSRYNLDGSLDRSFGTGGAALLPEIAGEDGVRGLAIEPDGRVVAAAGGAALSLVGLTPTGQLDPAFGSAGPLQVPSNERFTPNGIVATGDGLVASGESAGRVALARYGSDGSIDRSFGDRGLQISSIPAFDAGTERAAVQPDGRIVVGGSRRGRLALARFAADGSLDRTFGDGGETVSDVRVAAAAVAAAPGGDIVVAGAPPAPGDGGFMVARFDGSTSGASAGASTAGDQLRPALAAAKPRRPGHRLGPPNPVPAWYINASNFKELKQFAAQDACKFAHTQPQSAQRSLVLDFGGARAYPDGGFGAAVNNATFEATNQQILAALKAAADAYAVCHRQGRATIAYANTNHFDVRPVAVHAHQIGVHQAKTVARFGVYVHGADYGRAEHAGVAGDIEPGYWGASQSKAMVDGAKAVRHHDYMDFGTAGGCPPYLKGQHRPKHHKCLNDWTLDDVAHVSNAGGGEPLPEIYYRGGRLHYDQAAQWARVAQRWNSRHATPYTFYGATASTEFSSLTPSDSWKRLKRMTPGHVGRELLNFRQDRGPTLTAARNSDAHVR